MNTAIIEYSCTISPTPLVSESSPKGNDSKMSDKTGGQKSNILTARSDWLIALCQSNLGDKSITDCDDWFIVASRLHPL